MGLASIVAKMQEKYLAEQAATLPLELSNRLETARELDLAEQCFWSALHHQEVERKKDEVLRSK